VKLQYKMTSDLRAFWNYATQLTLSSR